MNPLLTDLQAQWLVVAPIFSLRNETEYDDAVARLNALVDEVGTNEQHPLYGLLETLGTVVHNYEQEHHSIPAAPANEVLSFLMEELGVDTAELSELGTPEDVQRTLAGDQRLSVEQIRALATRFHVSPAVFF